MKTIIEQSKKYDSLDSLQNDLALHNVRETTPFRLNQMELTTRGTVRVIGMYPGEQEYPLTQISLEDAIKRGGLQVSCCQNFFQENQYELDDVIVKAINSYYRCSSTSNSEIKLITREEENGQRVAVGIPSAKYVLYTHQEYLQKLSKNIPPNLRFARANLYPEYLDLGFTDPIRTARDKVGEIVELGLSFNNSEGTRSCSLISSCFSLRLICTNGAVAAHPAFSIRHAHRGDLHNNTQMFIEKTEVILQRFHELMENLPRLGDMPITEQFIQEIHTDLIDAIKSQKTEEFMNGLDKTKQSIGDVWDKVTNMPHNIKNSQTKMKLEQLGFRILTLSLL
ncbi:MAG: DUF932 domain-containing protein [Candidatus Brocadiae bacterium]|nr:DUF932 domain-containing protein [Candidatus Brocadiia bacterium]